MLTTSESNPARRKVLPNVGCLALRRIGMEEAFKRNRIPLMASLEIQILLRSQTLGEQSMRMSFG